MKRCLPFVDLLQYNRKNSVASLLSACRGVVLSSARLSLWESGLNSTVGEGSSMGLPLNGMAARDFEATGQVDDAGRHTMFSQAFRILNIVAPKSLRRKGQLYSVSDSGAVNLTYGLDAVDQGVRRAVVRCVTDPPFYALARLSLSLLVPAHCLPWHVLPPRPLRLV